VRITSNVVPLNGTTAYTVKSMSVYAP
jgi:hypothetical protein